ncbi:MULTISPECIES: slipin family protein [Mycobacteroides]|jgi:regulator of protease activity HflC (stomatin/prohibitin superfamily)|nr:MULTISPECIES: slipin family protein [Mycobacteroides]MBF9329383.1 slipin family protein [Mycobacteroides chelonae]MBF9350732.1 slipin family protein [Mycobacteroides chelonae]MBF9422835.1 slipin family protein [Mycobacteroides chelonae]MBF9435098.1 slipin family protein [Mycobacteroides chelonae]MBV6363195.1 slipin family protein [Mycobacteroides chelonae]
MSMWEEIFGQKITIMQWQRGVLYRDGVFKAVLTPGVHYTRPRTDTLVTVDMRAQSIQVVGQDVLTVDGFTVKVSAAVEYKVSVPDVFATAESGSVHWGIYLRAQLRVRDAVAALTLDELLAQRGQFLGADAVARLAAEAEEFGVTVTRFVVKDIMLSGEVRKALAGPLLAREAGKAQLERARAEAAVLRSMANTAKLLRENPELLQLRTLESVADGKAMVVLNR